MQQLSHAHCVNHTQLVSKLFLDHGGHSDKYLCTLGSFLRLKSHCSTLAKAE